MRALVRRLAAATDRFDQRLAGRGRTVAAAAAATAVVTVTSLTLVLLAPLPGRGDSAWLSLDVIATTDSTPAGPPADLPRRLGGSAPAVAPSAGPVRQPSGEFVGWAILDRRTGSVLGSANMAEVSTTASMIKSWVVADYLRLAAEGGWQPGDQRLAELEIIIRDSDNESAERVFRELGAAESIERLLRICRLTDSRSYQDFWSNTQLSPRDTARLAACIADGRAAGPEWTEWLLEQMRAVRGAGDFGVRQAFPADQRAGIAIKNGWIDRTYDGNWHVNCLAIGDTWTMGVMLRYPVRLGFTHGADLCESLATEHLLPRVPRDPPAAVPS